MAWTYKLLPPFIDHMGQKGFVVLVAEPVGFPCDWGEVTVLGQILPN